MKRIWTLGILMLVLSSVFAQTDSLPKPRSGKGRMADLTNRANDHLLIQIGYDGWSQRPDSIKTKGFSHSVNVYFMFDFPFKTDPHFSVGIGAGIGSSNIFFNKMIVDVAGLTPKLQFRNVADTNYFKRFKVVSTYAEIPVELRYSFNPENPNKSFKLAIGAKAGALLAVHSKGRILLNKTGGTINTYTEKQTSKKYFNGSRIAMTFRVGYGSISLFGSYQINNFIKDGVGPNVKPYSIGLTISGL